jgi:hypothetical protein
MYGYCFFTKNWEMLLEPDYTSDDPDSLRQTVMLRGSYAECLQSTYAIHVSNFAVSSPVTLLSW